MGSRQRRSLPSRHAFLLAAAVVSGCALQLPAANDACDRAFARFQSATAAVRDAQYHPLANFPGLRSNRVLAALVNQATSPAARRLWLQRLAGNDREAAAIERGNLAAGDGADLPDPTLLESCRQRQVETVANDAPTFARAAAAARIPSDYRPWARTLGLYPLLRPVYRRSIAAWQREAVAQQAPADNTAWLSYRLAEPIDGTPLPPLRADALGLPQATAEQLDTLFAHHAPELRIAAQSAADRPGAPLFDSRGRRGFAREPAIVYRRQTWSRLDGRWHLQLVYQWWFSARPAAGPLDLYAGELDGLLWRVTLDERGQAILFDAIHPCGCWHAFFLPADSPLQFRQPADEEQRLARRLTLAGSEAATLWLRAGDHALLWVDGRRAPYPIHRYRLAELDELRRLPHPAGRRSLYGSDGLVPGSQRLERWLLWPSGVVSPGAMRQWGRHASAFIGEAHFDDPDLLGRYFHSHK